MYWPVTARTRYSRRPGPAPATATLTYSLYVRISICPPIGLTTQRNGRPKSANPTTALTQKSRSNQDRRVNSGLKFYLRLRRAFYLGCAIFGFSGCLVYSLLRALLDRAAGLFRCFLVAFPASSMSSPADLVSVCAKDAEVPKASTKPSTTG